jgi:hypothetical protein
MESELPPWFDRRASTTCVVLDSARTLTLGTLPARKLLKLVAADPGSPLANPSN